MVESAALVAFVLASTALAVTPGPGVAYIVTRTLAQGRRAGFASLAGVALGNLLNSAGAALGLAALLAVSRWAFTLLQVGGALYLFWLALRVLRPPQTGDAATAVPATGPWPLFRDGALVALLNPKTALFFAAFLPQFMDARQPALPQALALGALFVLIAVGIDALYVFAAARLAPWLAGRGRARGAAHGRREGNRPSPARLATAAVYIALGLGSLFAGVRQAR